MKPKHYPYSGAKKTPTVLVVDVEELFKQFNRRIAEKFEASLFNK